MREKLEKVDQGKTLNQYEGASEEMVKSLLSLAHRYPIYSETHHRTATTLMFPGIALQLGSASICASLEMERLIHISVCACGVYSGDKALCRHFTCNPQRQSQRLYFIV